MSSNRQLDRLYAELHAREPDVRNGGVDADKPGYHNKRGELIRDGRTRDYSIAQVAADKRGNAEVSAGIDLTFISAQRGDYATIQRYTGRLKAAALARDPRLWLRGGPTLREFIGNVAGQVYCYVLTGGVPLGVGADSGPDPGRGSSHLWHIHLSVIRQYAEDWAALDAVLSVMLGESLDAWRVRTGTGGSDMAELTGMDEKRLGYVDARVEAFANGTPTIRSDAAYGAGQAHWGVRTLAGVAAAVGQIGHALGALDEQLAGRLAEVEERLTAEIDEVADEVIGALPTKPLEAAATALIEAGGRDWAANLRDALSAALSDPQV